MKIFTSAQYFLSILALILLTACGGGGSDSTSETDTTDNTVSEMETINNAPIANAGVDQVVTFGTTTVILDGGESSDADEDDLTYLWTLTELPSGSTASLSDTNSESANLSVDLAGDYVVTLTVNDGIEDSSEDAITITVNAETVSVIVNSVPVANAGIDQVVTSATTSVILDGSGSSDTDDDDLTYLWVLTQLPSGSAASLSDTSLESPSLTTDLAGDYVVTLTVNDGVDDSNEDTTTITVNNAPVANAGVDQDDVLSTATVYLDGTSSSDIDGASLTYTWSFSSVPSESTASLSNVNAASPNFVPDESGDYVIDLIVNDGVENSATDSVNINVNGIPRARAGNDRSVDVGDTVTLHAIASSDPDDDPLTYA